MGQQVHGSDIDLAVQGLHQKPLNMRVHSQIKEAFEESSLPYFVDVVDYYQVSDKLFLEQLSRASVLIYSNNDRAEEGI